MRQRKSEDPVGMLESSHQNQYNYRKEASFMKTKVLFLVILLIAAAALVWSQNSYTGFDLERAKPQTLFPTRGPGDSAIVNELRETNRLLQEQNQLLQEQNRLLKAHLTTKK
jgi:hypothetical protein